MSTEKGLIIVTGASSGIGAETAKLFSKEGHPLLLLARRDERLRELGLDNAICRKADLNDADSVTNAFEEAQREFGPVDCLVNNAGVMQLGEIETQSEEEWARMIDVNILALMRACKLAIPSMKRRNSGTIINISSIAGIKTFPNHSAYCATKFAVHGFTENLRQELCGSNIRVTTVAPGAVETELLSHTTRGDIIDGYEDWKSSMGGVIVPQDIARSIYFAYSQPQSVCIRELVISATKQVE